MHDVMGLDHCPIGIEIESLMEEKIFGESRQRGV